ncbi:MAG: FecR domain-containing protein [Bacteroidales bacterium]|jgi:ferric-dicitrate binding protein FerR (iron transport regulator)|nr:FecR domain-containing protein [Bacteroidales bacterium]
MKKENTHSNKMEDKERKTFDEFLSGQDQAVQKYWMEMNEIGRSEKADTDKAWDKLYGRLQEDKLIPGKKFLVTRSFRIAASIIIIMGLAFTGLYIGLTNTGRNSENIILTDAGQKNVRVDLPDGSTVFLNRNSSITYPDRFDSQSRTVKLEGEAYFDIESDSKRPFTVNAGDADVTVLGTSFNVNTGNNRVEVLVTSGEVLLKNHGGEESVKLQQGDLGLLSDDSASKSLNSDPNYLSWKTEILVFEGDSLGKVIRDLKRVHNINIETGNDEIRKLRVTSVFDNQSHETIIRIICTTFNLDYYKEGDKYFLDTK